NNLHPPLPPSIAFKVLAYTPSSGASASQISGSCPSIVTNTLSTGTSSRQSPGAALLSSSGPKRHCTLSTGTRYSFNWWNPAQMYPNVRIHMNA
ncbi:hypothetical protein F442_19904, partial [Phytophthora nicotianae P10297]